MTSHSQLACNFPSVKNVLLFSDFISSPVCYEYKDYIGHDITSYEGIENPYECQMRCQGINQCTFWSWIDTDLGAKQCWIKEYIVNKNEHGSQGQSVISGPKSCGTNHSNVRIQAKFQNVISILLPETCLLDMIIEDGTCDDEYNIPDCGYDGGDCCGSQNVYEFCTSCECLQIDDFTIKVTKYPESCPLQLQFLVGDAFCDDDLNTLDCHFDGGDCCGSEANLDYCILCECREIDSTTIKVAEFTNGIRCSKLTDR